MIPIDQLLLIGAILLLAGVFASKVSDRLGVPALLLFLAVGMLAGEEGLLGIPFNDTRLTQALGTVALAFILFAGGLETDWSSVRPILWRGFGLATLGVAVTAAIFGLFARFLLDFTWVEAMLLGSIVSSTDAAAVFSVLRSRGASLKGRLKPLLEFESGSNDPMAVFLTMAMIRLITEPEAPLSDLLIAFALQMPLGAAVGAAVGWLSVRVVNRLKLESEGLYPVATLSLAMLAYSAATVAQGNGFLSVYVAGIVFGNSDFIHKRSLIRFHDGLGWLMQITMFVLLGLLVYPSNLITVAIPGFVMAAVLMLVARPVAVFLTLAFARLGLRHKLMISWVGLRGAVPIILATFPFVAGLPNAALYFDIVFFIVLTSVLLQGTSLTFVAGRLGLQAPAPRRRANALEDVVSGEGGAGLTEVGIVEGAAADGRQIIDLQLPKSILIVLLERNGDYLVPRGGTQLLAGDRLFLLGDPQQIAGVSALFNPTVASEETD